MKNNFIKGLIMAIVAFAASAISDGLAAGTLNWLYIVITSLGIVLTYIGKNAAFKSVSQIGTIDWLDGLSGLILALGTAISAFAASVIASGAIDWKALLIAVVTTTLGYLSKNFASNSQGVLLTAEKK